MQLLAGSDGCDRFGTPPGFGFPPSLPRNRPKKFVQVPEWSDANRRRCSHKIVPTGERASLTNQLEKLKKIFLWRIAISSTSHFFPRALLASPALMIAWHHRWCCPAKIPPICCAFSLCHPVDWCWAHRVGSTTNHRVRCSHATTRNQMCRWRRWNCADPVRHPVDRMAQAYKQVLWKKETFFFEQIRKRTAQKSTAKKLHVLANVHVPLLLVLLTLPLHGPIKQLT